MNDQIYILTGIPGRPYRFEAIFQEIKVIGLVEVGFLTQQNYSWGGSLYWLYGG